MPILLWKWKVKGPRLIGYAQGPAQSGSGPASNQTIILSLLQPTINHHSISESTNRSINESTNHANDKSITQSNNQSINQSINQSMFNQSINEKYNHSDCSLPPQNGSVTLSVNGLQRTEKIPASHDFLDENVKTLFIGGTKKESMDYEGVALPNFQVLGSGFPI